jgi:Ca2+-binding EF-hand superfamily protein
MPATDAGSISTKSTGEFADSTLAKYTGGPDVDSGVDGELASLASDAKKREQKLAKEVKSRKDAKLAGLQSPALGGDTDGEDAEEERAGTVDQDANISEKIKNKTPEEIFALFDKSSDGKLSFEEFRDMLPQLGFKLSAAKALKYFRTVDSDGSGEIDLDEFKTAMFAIDPESGNPVGFAPNSLLTPMDAFQLFDEDNSGAIDEDEFFFLLKYLGVEVTEEKQEALFNKYDKDKSGMIEYAEFRKIWLHLANVKKELMDRGVKLPKFASTAQLGKMLETILDEEEHLEAKAMAEAAKWARWQAKLKHKRAAYDLARHLANSELQSALDAAGAVYVLGTGAFNEFAGDAPQALAMWGLPCNHWDELKKMWANRVLGRTATTGGAQESEERVDDMSDIASAPSSQLLQENPFKGLVVAKNTVAMWGRRISQVALSDSTAFALSDFGEIYAWGGRSHWYHEIRPDSYWQSHWRGDTTERSRLMLQTTKKMEPIELPLDDGNILDPEDAEIEKLRLVAEYYGVWKPPPSTNRLLYVKQELLSKVTIDRMRFSLEMRGKYPEGLNKNELTALLCECLGLELKTLGNLRHRQLRQMELDIISFTKRKRKAQAKSLRLEMERMWQPLREIEAEDAALERAKAAAETESLYRSAEIAYIAHRKKMDEARRNFSPKGKTPRGNSLELGISGITARAGSTLTPRAADSASSVVAGSAHAFLVHHTGDLYAWGVSLSGRLGLDDQVKDAEAPTIVQSLRGQPIIEASAGFSHSAAVAIGGRLYTWGSGACGKLGIGR